MRKILCGVLFALFATQVSAQVLNPVTPLAGGAAVGNGNPLPVGVSPMPVGATAVTASATGTTAATTATLAAAVGKTTYICGFYFTGTNATAANTATSLTITGTIGGTMTFGFPTLAAAATVPNTLPLDEAFQPCIAASAANTAIVVNGPALGAGSTLTTISAWGYQF